LAARDRIRWIPGDRESEIASLSADEQAEYVQAVGLSEPGLNRVIRAGYDPLPLIPYCTAGPKEPRAWTVEKGTRAPQAAGVIHTDFEKGFIRAETIAYDDYVRCSSLELSPSERARASARGHEGGRLLPRGACDQVSCSARR